MRIKEELQEVESRLSSLWDELQHWSKEQGHYLNHEQGEVGGELALALHIEAYNLRRQELAQLRQKQLDLRAKLEDELGDDVFVTDQSQIHAKVQVQNHDQAEAHDQAYLQQQVHAMQLAQAYEVQRKGTNCRKWDGMEEQYGANAFLPMWVADMDFAIAKPIQENLITKVRDAAMGYSLITDNYYQAVMDWHEKAFGYCPQKSWFFHAPGAMTAVHWAIEALLEEDEGVVVFSPLYPPLYQAAELVGRPLFDLPMLLEENHDGSVTFTIDWALLEETLQANKIKALILCSPQNPVGRVWTKAELLHLGEFAEKYDLLLLVDEMHQDLVADGYVQQAILALEEGRFSQRTVVISSASKTFNLAGLPLANMLVANPLWQQKLQVYIPKVYLGKPNTLAVEATTVAYLEGAAWLADIKKILQANREYFEHEFLSKNPDLRFGKMEGTYMVFVDFGSRLKADKIRSFMLEGCKIAPSFGIDFGKDYGTWVRLNLATSPKLLRQVVERLQMGLDFLKLSML